MLDEKSKRHTKNLIDWGASIITAEMDHYPKAFVVGLLKMVRREIIPNLSQRQIDAMTHEGYEAMQVRKYKGKFEKPMPGAVKAQHFYESDKVEKWMTA